MRNDFFKHILLSGGSRQNRTELETETLPYTFTSNSHKLRNYRIYGNTVNGQSVGDLVTEGEHSGEDCIPVKIRKAKHTATLQLHDCLPTTMQIDAPEALYYAENGLAAGTYNFTIQDYDTSHGGGKRYQFTLSNAVPIGGQLTFGWGRNTQAHDAKIASYASSTSTTAIEVVSVAEGSDGTSIGTTDGRSRNVNHIHRIRYGSNNYENSAIRQFLNSSASAGNVWSPKTKYDRPPSWSSNTAGFIKDIDSRFLSVLCTSHKVVIRNNVTDGGGSVTLHDKFFMLACSEVYGRNDTNVNEGNPYPYYSDYSDLSEEGTNSDSNRIKNTSGTNQAWGLRTPYHANSATFRGVTAVGEIMYTVYPVNLYGIAPACNIAIDEDYKFNGQVLHIRDQITVTKGNETLVFDVIGLDHDDVDFDDVDLDTTTTNLYLPEQIKMVGDEAEYVDYKEQKQYFADGTSTDVTLPALLTIAGTNTLSIDTAVQPSKVYLQGKISEIETVSAQSLQASPRTLDLQPLSLDVMPIDRDEFQINDISEMSVEEIPETENLETTGDEENAEGMGATVYTEGNI